MAWRVVIGYDGSDAGEDAVAFGLTWCRSTGDVPVVATGVHLARMLRPIRDRIRLVHRQRVHIRAEQHAAIPGSLL